MLPYNRFLFIKIFSFRISVIVAIVVVIYMSVLDASNKKVELRRMIMYI